MSRYLARAVAAFVAIVLVVLIVPIAWLATSLVKTDARERAERQATVVAAAVTATGLEGAATVFPRDPQTRTVVVTIDGDVVADTAPGEALPALPTMAEVTGGAPLTDPTDGAISAAAPILRGDDVAGMAVVTIAPALIEGRIRDIGILLVAISVVVVTAAAGFGVLLARSLVRPVEALDSQAGALAEGSLDARVTVPDGPPELRRLAASFNELAARLDTVVSAQRAFTSDAAHQFRTPLTVLRLRLEALDERLVDDADVAVATREVAHLHRLIDDLLALTRLERRTDRPATVALGPAVRAHCELWTAMTEQHDIGLRTRAPRDGPVVSVRQGTIEQILDSYLENALRVAPRGSTIDVTVTEREGRAELRVADRGPGLQPDERTHAFDRFWRGSHASRDDGTGLGLAIVARLATADGGTARLDPRTGGGTIAVATFPRSTADTNTGTRAQP